MVVVGGGHNGLVCAAYLANAGLDVVVLEQNPEVGGALFTTRSAAGFTLDHGALEHTGMAGSGIVEELDLGHHGLSYNHRTVAGVQLFADGTQIAIGETAEETAQSIAEVEPRDAAAWLELARLSRPMLAALSATSGRWSVPVEALVGVARTVPSAQVRELVALASGSVIDLAARWFRSPYLRALAVSRAWFTGAPPWYRGTGAVFCLTPGGHGRRFARPVGGSRALAAALAAAVESAGGRIVRDQHVARIEQAGSRWSIHTTGGESYRATRAVVSTIPPQTTLLELVSPRTLVPERIRRRLTAAEVVPTNVAQLTLSAALEAPPSFATLPSPAYAGSMLAMFASPRAVLDTYVAAALGELPEHPGAWVSFPSAMDPTAAPPGAATMWANSFITHRLSSGRSWSSVEDEVTQRLLDSIDACLPGVRARIVDAVLTSPDTLTARTGAENPGSHLAPTLRQSGAGRPALGLAGYRALPGLYLSGAGTNPGGGVNGIAGRNAAQRVLADLTGGLLGGLVANVRLAGPQLADAGAAVRALRGR